jgi:hypothetical protein
MVVKKRKKTKKPEVVEINGQFFRVKANGKPGVELTHNANTLTESAFFGLIRSALRRASQFWKPKIIALNAKGREYTGTNKRIKREYQCDTCSKWFVRAKIEVNHKVECGSLRSFEDIPDFCRRLFVEDLGGWEVLCLTCHQLETNKQ